MNLHHSLSCNATLSPLALEEQVSIIDCSVHQHFVFAWIYVYYNDITIIGQTDGLLV